MLTTGCPSSTRRYDVLQVFELMHQGKVNGYFCQGFNPLAAFPNKEKIDGALAKLKYLVVIDPLATETSEFWQNHGEYNDVDPPRSRPRCSGCPPPASPRRTARWSTAAAGCNGTGRAPSRRARPRPTPRSWPASSCRLRELYKKEGGAFPDPILNLTWPYMIAACALARGAGEGVQRQGAGGRHRPQGPDQGRAGQGRRAAGRLRPAAGRRHHRLRLLDLLRAPGPSKGNLMARRDNSDPSGLGSTLSWAFAWPANRRILYNRASCDPSGKPWDPKRKLIALERAASGPAPTCPTSRPTRRPTRA